MAHAWIDSGVYPSANLEIETTRGIENVRIIVETIFGGIDISLTNKHYVLSFIYIQIQIISLFFLITTFSPFITLTSTFFLSSSHNSQVTIPYTFKLLQHFSSSLLPYFINGYFSPFMSSSNIMLHVCCDYFEMKEIVCLMSC